jgi:hypothetical protein
VGNGGSAFMITCVPRQVDGWDTSLRDGNEVYKTFFLMAELGNFAVQFAAEKVELVPVNLRVWVPEGICLRSQSSRRPRCDRSAPVCYPGTVAERSSRSRIPSTSGALW